VYRKSCKKNKTWNGLIGRLCQSIDLDNRHRAGGDADATAILFTRLLVTKEMDVMIKKTSRSAITT
jgi:hypothetical protein